MNKIFVFGWIGIWAILVIENLVTWMSAYVFLSTSSSSGILSLVSIIVWIFIWYGLKWMFEKDHSAEDESYDF
jgi:hypothetical protein